MNLRDRLTSPVALRDSRGVAAVEFAVVFPLAILLILGTIEVGNLFYTWLTVQKSAQMATRFAATGQGEVDGTRMNLIRAEVARLTDNLPGYVSVGIHSWPTTDTSATPRDNDAGEPCEVVEVSVDYTYIPITPLVGDVFPDHIPLSGADRKINEPWLLCN